MCAFPLCARPLSLLSVGLGFRVQCLHVSMGFPAVSGCLWIWLWNKASCCFSGLIGVQVLSDGDYAVLGMHMSREERSMASIY